MGPATPATLLFAVVLHVRLFPDLQRKVASAVAWERRERGGRYYIRSRREKGRVVREYVGTGPFAEIVAATDRTRQELEKAEREQEKDRQRRQLERLEALAAPVEELSEAAEVLVRAHLVDDGCHRRRGEWRRARGKARSA